MHSTEGEGVESLFIGTRLSVKKNLFPAPAFTRSLSNALLHVVVARVNEPIPRVPTPKCSGRVEENRPPALRTSILHHLHLPRRRNFNDGRSNLFSHHPPFAAAFSLPLCFSQRVEFEVRGKSAAAIHWLLHSSSPSRSVRPSVGAPPLLQSPPPPPVLASGGGRRRMCDRRRDECVSVQKREETPLPDITHPPTAHSRSEKLFLPPQLCVCAL